MKRRVMIVGSSGLVAMAVVGARAQASREPRRIGWLSPHPHDFGHVPIDAFTAQLKGLGYLPGHEILIETRFADRNLDRLPALAQELVALQPTLIVASGNPATAALMQATRDIPIVMSNANTPVESGLVASLSRPGGNVTGTTYNQPQIAGKAVEVLKAAAPSCTRVTIIWNPDISGIQPYKPHADHAAKLLGVALQYMEVRTPKDFSLETLLKTNPEALYVVPDLTVTANVSALVRFAKERKLPSISFYRQFAVAEGLISLSPEERELNQNLADLVDRILRGAKPADLPVREPSRYQLVINRRTANAIGLKILPDLLIRADEVID